MGAAKAGEVRPWYYPSVSEYSTLAERNGLEVRLITLFDRPTGLADGAAGMRNWIVMFGADYLAKAGEARREEFLRQSRGVACVPNYFATDSGGPITGGCGWLLINEIHHC